MEKSGGEGDEEDGGDDEERMENLMRMARASLENEQRTSNCRKCRARCEQCLSRTSESLHTLIGEIVWHFWQNYKLISNVEKQIQEFPCRKFEVE